MPPVSPPSFVCWSSWAARRPSLTAASTMSWSSSGSSGSIASGAMVIALTTRSPDTLTLTIPPPAEASTSSCLSASWASSMSCCIFWTCFIICCMFGGWGISGLAFLLVVWTGDDLLGIELCHQARDELVLRGRRRPLVGRELAQLEGHLQRPAGQAAHRRLDHRAMLRGVDHSPFERLSAVEGDDELVVTQVDRARVGERGADELVVGADRVADGGPEGGHAGEVVRRRRGGGRRERGIGRGRLGDRDGRRLGADRGDGVPGRLARRSGFARPCGGRGGLGRRGRRARRGRR